MNEEEGVTIVLTTHYMEEADYLCDRVAIIDSGKIVALDTPEHIKDMIGADTITLDVERGGDALLNSLKPFDWIRSAAVSNGNIELMADHAQARVPDVMAQAYKSNAVVKSVGFHEPTLEDVFIKFTGRKIREAEGPANIMRAMMMHRRRG
jgi:ABC-2 type transport system ATP-binding protein